MEQQSELSEAFLVEEVSMYLSEGEGEDRGFMGRMWDRIKKFFASIRDGLNKLWTWIKEKVSSLWNKLKSALGGADTAEVDQELEESGKVYKEAAVEASLKGLKTVTDGGKKLTGMLGKLISKLRGTDGAVENVEFKKQVEDYKELIQKHLSDLTEANRKGKTRILSIKTSKDAEAAQKAAESLMGEGSNLVKELNAMIDTLKAEEAKHAKGGIISKLAGMVTSVASQIGLATRKFMSNLSNIVFNAIGTVTNFLQRNKDRIAKGLGKAGEGLKNGANKLKDGAKNAFGKVKDHFS